MGVTPHVRTCVRHFYNARTAESIAFKLGRYVKETDKPLPPVT